MGNLDSVSSLFESSPDAVTVTDFAGVLVHANPAGRALERTSSITTVLTADIVEELRTVGVWTGSTDASIRRSVSSVVVHDQDGTPFIVSIRREADGHRPTAGSSIAREQQVVAEISRRALVDDLEPLLDFAVTAALSLMDTRCASVFRPTSGTGDLALAAYAGPTPAPTTVPAGMNSQPGYALHIAGAVVCADREQERRFSTDSMAARGLRSGVSVPITGDTEPWGVLTVHSTEPRLYSSREIAFLGTVCDILSAAIRRSELEKRLRHRSVHDPLTGLPNRELIDTHLARALEHGAVTDTRVAVLLVDFDNFKSINDHFGHDIGDIALVAVARRLSDAVDSEATGNSAHVFRLGGDEFLILLEALTDTSAATKTALGIGRALRIPLTIEGRSVPLSASIGIALSDKDIEARQLVHRADVAMYRAKSQLPGNHAVYDADDDRQARHHLTMSTDLRAAIDNDELSLRYVPIHDTRTGAITSFSTAPRWEHPALGVLNIDEFLTTAERTGLIEALGSWVLRGACRDAATWLADHDSIEVRVDVVAAQIRQEGFIGTVMAAVNSAGIAANNLVISVPESALTPADERIGQALAELRSRGVRLLLDNSSGGHSSIRNLAQFPYFEFFQVDNGDVAATFREHFAVVLESVVALIHAVGARVVADAIQHVDQLEAATAAGCDFAQGPYFGNPLTVQDIASALADTRRP